MRRILFISCLLLSISSLYASIPVVPSQMEFGGMKLKITEAARNEMQKQVNSLRASDKYFRIKLDRVNLYFPIIERVFKEANLPDDFKYLVIQESALISDAVSSANAVGFWQFKDFTGREVGLRIDNQVDERINIVSATRGAAKYLKTNNFYYKNWVYALMAYNTGRGGARKYVNEELYGAGKMTIDKNTHWYVKTFLAHKIAFQNEIGGKHSEGLSLQEYEKGGGENFSKIAGRFGIEKELVSYYNKWLKRGSVPTDKTYAVILPVKERISDRKLAVKKAEPVKNVNENIPDIKTTDEVKSKYSRFLKPGLENAAVVYVEINGIDGVLAAEKDNIKSLSAKGGVPVSKFIKYNDLSTGSKIKPGAIYYLRSKKGKSKVSFHVLKPNESLWDVSQKYGIKLKKLKKYNRIKTKKPKSGTVLWLSSKISKGVDPVIASVDTKYVLEKGAGVNNSPKPTKLPPVKKVEKSAKEEKQTNPPVIIEEKKVPADVEEKSGKSNIIKIDPIIERVAPDTVSADKPKKVLIVESVESETLETVIEKEEFDFHEVVAGQTLFSIAQKYGFSVNDLINWNNLDPYNTILDIGQKLAVKRPFQSPEEVEEIPEEKVLYHIVQPGETAYGISKQYDITVAQLIEWNKLSDNADISIEQKLKVSGVFTEQKTSKKEKTIQIDDERVKPVEKEVISPDEESNSADFHEVKPGDTLYSISRKYKLSVMDLIRINNKNDANIDIGEKIKIRE